MKKTKRPLWKDIGLMSAIALTGGMVLCGIIGVLVSRQIVSEQIGASAAIILTELLLLTCACAAARKQGKNRLLITMLVAVICAAVRLTAGGGYHYEQSIEPVGCLITVGVGVCAGLLSMQKKQRRR